MRDSTIRWAMSAWGQTLRADCVDEAGFEEFYDSYGALGPEDICGGGILLTEETLPANCGEWAPGQMAC